MLLTNGRTYTLDARGTIADTLVVRDGRVAFAGRRADVNAAPGEDIVDLGGRNGDQNLWPGARLPSPGPRSIGSRRIIRSRLCASTGMRPEPVPSAAI